MTESEYQAREQEATALLKLSAEQQDFWAGYLHGLRRHYHGSQFSSEEELRRWLDSPTRGTGFRLGLSGVDIQSAIEAA